MIWLPPLLVPSCKYLTSMSTYLYLLDHSIVTNSNARNNLFSLHMLRCDPIHARLMCTLRVSLPLDIVLHVNYAQCITSQAIYELLQLNNASHIVLLCAHELPPNIFVSHMIFFQWPLRRMLYLFPDLSFLQRPLCLSLCLFSDSSLLKWPLSRMLQFLAWYFFF